MNKLRLCFVSMKQEKIFTTIFFNSGFKRLYFLESLVEHPGSQANKYIYRLEKICFMYKHYT